MARWRDGWTPAVRKVLPAMRAWRVAFHQEPELSLHEDRTREKILVALDDLGIPHREFADFPGVVATIVVPSAETSSTSSG